MPIRTIGEYLKRWGLTVQRPAKREMEQKPEQVKAWLNEQYPAIHQEAKAEKAVIFWGDETAVQNTANYARGYSPKGKTPILKVKAKKMHINMISAINNQGKLHFLLYSDAINSDRLISFMDAIIKSSEGRKVDERKEKIRLFYLPPYSPEYNPDEYLNNDLKRNLGTQAMAKSVEELETNTQEFMSKLSNNPDHVQSYFDHPALDDYKLD